MDSIYYTLYNLIQNIFYGSTALSGWQDMTLTLLSTIGCIFVFAIPFIVCYKIIQIIMGR